MIRKHKTGVQASTLAPGCYNTVAVCLLGKQVTRVRFSMAAPKIARMAQWRQQSTCNAPIGGSSPSPSSIIL
jgi:hypothetical protein